MSRTLLSADHGPDRPNSATVRGVTVLLVIIIVITVATAVGLSLVEVAASLGIVVGVLAVADRACGLVSSCLDAVPLIRQFGPILCPTR